ncbi:TPA: phosphohydrolase [Vibrio parahaemolyticus]|nr:phosphohydrolase [Vibrio parahaemolyticus]HAV1539094.1 phosphohydrolase [Vibrio parahaemolyticus]
MSLLSDNFDDQIIIPSLRREVQLDMFGSEVIAQNPANPHEFFHAPDIDVDEYDVVVLAFSGGKDSIAAFLRLLDMGVPRERIELWHHLVDGHTSEEPFMDWVFMDAYCEAFAREFGVKYYRSWLHKGFKGEMLKNNSKPHHHVIETPDGFNELPRPLAKPGTRMKYPQQGADLRTRWCSSELKINVGKRGLTSQDRFLGFDKKVLYITGERREESSNRSKYMQLSNTPGVDTIRGKEGKRVMKPRFVDSWRNVLHFTEEEVWELIAKYRVIPPVPYRLGWGRSSCMTCIFNGDRIFATLLAYFPERVEEIAHYEDDFGLAISRDGRNVLERARAAKPFEIKDDEALLQAAQKEYFLPIILKENQPWVLPSGAFASESSGAN